MRDIGKEAESVTATYEFTRSEKLIDKALDKVTALFDKLLTPLIGEAPMFAYDD